MPFQTPDAPLRSVRFAAGARPFRLIHLILCLVCVGSAHGEESTLRAESLSPDIGLVDLTLAPDSGITAPMARFTDASGQPREIPLQPRASDGPALWTARIASGIALDGTRIGPRRVSSRLPIEVTWRDAQGQPRTRGIVVDLTEIPEPRVPTWAMGRVWYQVFPERFANAEPANDPALDPDELGSVTLPWDHPWYEVSVDEVEAAWHRRQAQPAIYDDRPSDLGGAWDAVVFRRRFGGDLQGVVERLDWMRSLGVDGLYLCPVFASRSLHKYDARDHRHVDPHFGPPDPDGRRATFTPPEDPADETTWPWTLADRYLIDTLIPEARKRGMRVVLDGVWNHVGIDHWAFRDVFEHGRDSRFADWFDARFDDQGRLIGWSGWARENGDLPEFEQSGGDLNPGAKAHIFAITRRWMDPNGDGDPSDGIDGWRLDVAAEMGRVFWRDWRALVKSINPEAIIVGEVWFDADDYFDGTAFDAQMHYPFAFAAANLLALDPMPTARGFFDAMDRVSGRRPAVDLMQYTLLASHDTERVASMMMNPASGSTIRNYDTGAGRDDVWRGAYDPSEPTDEALERSILAVALQATWPGAPMIYGGDELGLPGADDPSNRIPIDWTRLDTDPRARATADAYAAWLTLRDHPVAGPVLRFGAVRPLSHPDERVLAFERTLNGVRVTVQINISDRPARPIATDADETLIAGPAGAPQTGVLPPRSARAWLSGG